VRHVYHLSLISTFSASISSRVRLDWLTFELMQINKILSIIHKLVKVVYKNSFWKYNFC